MALGNGSTPNGGVTQEKAPVVNGTNMETLPRAGKQVISHRCCSERTNETSSLWHAFAAANVMNALIAAINGRLRKLYVSL